MPTGAKRREKREAVFTRTAKLFRGLLRRYRRSTLKSKLVTIVLLQAAFLVIGYAYVVRAENRRQMLQYESRSLQAAASLCASADTILRVLEYVTAFPVAAGSGGEGEELFNMLDAGGSTDSQRYLQLFRANTKYFLDVYPYLDLIAIYDRGGKGNYIAKYTGSAAYETSCAIEDFDAPWYRRTLRAQGAASAVTPEEFVGTGIHTRVNDFFCVSRSLMHVQSNPFHSVGVIVVGVRRTYFDDLFGAAGSEPGQRYALYYKGRLAAGGLAGDPNLERILAGAPRNGGGLFRESLDGEPCLYSVYGGDADTVAVIRNDYGSIYSRSATYGPAFYLIILVFLAITLFIVYSIVDGIFIPVRALVRNCNTLEQEDFSVSMKEDVSREFLELYTAFGNMSGRIRVLVKDVLTQNLAKRELELQLLRTQINPHYLYNTLESMSMLAYSHGEKQIAEMAALLGHNLQYGLRKTNAEVLLSDELASLREYVTLISCSAQARLNVEINVPEELMNCRVIKLVLQPIVENALIHGLSGGQRELNVEIFGYADQGDLALAVSDDGAGIEEGQMRRLARSLERDGDNGGIGLKNVHRRLRLFYGERYGVSVKSVYGMGTQVSLRLPLKRGDVREGGAGDA